VAAQDIASSAAGHSLHIRLLGDLQVARDGRALPLPASKRTRALLGYLVATAAPQSRQALCDLLWDGPDDPRAALRWSLTKLRPLVDDEGATRLIANREHVAFETHGAHVDSVRVGELLGAQMDNASVDQLEEAAALLRDEFLDGVDLPTCYRFHHWCMAERERHGALRRRVLNAAIERLGQEPQRALPLGRALVAADPLSEPAHATLVRLLAAAGRYPDAEQHYAYALDLLRREVSAPAGGPLDESIRRVRHALRTAGERPTPPVAPAVAPITRATPAGALPTPATEPLLVGRYAERRAIDGALAASAGEQGLLLFVGEPGIGKTRLLDHVAATATARGYQVLRGRCYEAEMVRPYGLWLDALRVVPAQHLSPEALRDAAPLLARGNEASRDSSRDRLFGAAADLLRSLAGAQPVALVLDDLQWLDEGSAALLHFLVRTLGPGDAVRFAGAARAAEVGENTWAKGLLQSLARATRLQRLAVGALDAAEVTALLGSLAAPIEPLVALRESGGNPLFLRELARASERGERGEPGDGRTLDALIADHLEAIDDEARELLTWAAAMGRELRPELLADATGMPVASVLSRLDRLERRGLLKPSGEGHFDFVHDLVRQVVSRALSQPRRRAIHRQLARALAASAGDDPRVHGELVHHASLAGDSLLTARACLAAADHCLRVYANAEAAAVADRGLAHAAELPQGGERSRLTIALLKQRVVAAANSGARRLPALVGQIEAAVESADALALHADAASGLHILSWLSQQLNDTERTRTATLAAERMTRKADAATRCQQLANTGRCLLEVEAEVPRARSLISEAAELATAGDLRVIELTWGIGLIARADGDFAAARAQLEQAVALARLRDDHWREYECLVWLATIEFERGANPAVIEHGNRIVEVARRMGDAAAPFAQALCALAQLRLLDAGAADELAAHLEALRAADDKAHLAYALNAAASIELGAGRHHAALALAREALPAARAVQRPTEIAVATAHLVLAAAQAGNAAGVRDALAALQQLDGTATSARAAAAIERARGAIPTIAPTPAG
jgi:DNA-binding SARP family transcriptional activator/predicted ATPase